MAQLRFGRTLIAVYGLMWLFLGWCFWTPISFSALKLAATGASVFLAVGTVVWFPRGRICVALTSTVVALIFVWPARPANSPELSRAYVASMRNYLGTRYVWGGENGRGIDCSGLMRRGLVDALLSEGWTTKNPSLWREAATVWWRDCSALEMKRGYGNRIKQRFEADNLNEIDTSRLQPGDLAVLQNGVHVLAFAGEKTWIQADPNLVNGGDKVILTMAPSKNGWFHQPVVICRWRILDSAA